MVRRIATLGSAGSPVPTLLRGSGERFEILGERADARAKLVLHCSIGGRDVRATVAAEGRLGDQVARHAGRPGWRPARSRPMAMGTISAAMWQDRRNGGTMR